MYEWSFVSDQVREQYEALPADGRAAFDDLMSAVALVPFNFVQHSDPRFEGHAGASAMLDFAGGRGIAVVQVYEADEAVVVWSIQWLG